MVCFTGAVLTLLSSECIIGYDEKPKSWIGFIYPSSCILQLQRRSQNELMRLHHSHHPYSLPSDINIYIRSWAFEGVSFNLNKGEKVWVWKQICSLTLTSKIILFPLCIYKKGILIEDDHPCPTYQQVVPTRMRDAILVVFISSFKFDLFTCRWIKNTAIPAIVHQYQEGAKDLKAHQTGRSSRRRQ